MTGSGPDAREIDATFGAGAIIDAPETEIDPYSKGALLDPYPLYRMLRDLGPQPI